MQLKEIDRAASKLKMETVRELRLEMAIVYIIE